MRRFDEYLVTLDTIYPDEYVREPQIHAFDDLLSPAPMPVRSGLRRLVDLWVNWRQKRAGRLALREMSEDQLRDIGLTRREACDEARRSRLLTWL